MVCSELVHLLALVNDLVSKLIFSQFVLSQLTHLSNDFSKITSTELEQLFECSFNIVLRGLAFFTTRVQKLILEDLNFVIKLDGCVVFLLLNLVQLILQTGNLLLKIFILLDKLSLLSFKTLVLLLEDLEVILSQLEFGLGLSETSGFGVHLL